MSWRGLSPGQAQQIRGRRPDAVAWRGGASRPSTQSRLPQKNPGRLITLGLPGIPTNPE